MFVFLDGVCIFFFFKQKTAYDMRIMDWSSDVCSSDLHARRARDAGGDDDDVGARDVLVIVRAGDLRVEARDRPDLRQVERLALRHAFDHVEQHDVAEFLLRGEQSQRSADIPGADQRDLLTSHGSSEEHTSELQSLMRTS